MGDPVSLYQEIDNAIEKVSSAIEKFPEHYNTGIFFYFEVSILCTSKTRNVLVN